MGTYIGQMTSVSSSVQPVATGCFIGREMGCAFEGRWFESEVGNALCVEHDGIRLMFIIACF
jgi:hypothetical protein